MTRSSERRAWRARRRASVRSCAPISSLARRSSRAWPPPFWARCSCRTTGPSRRPTVMSRADSNAPDNVRSRYRILLPLAEGGMGTVHLAMQRGAVGFSRLVAVKRPHAQAMRSAELRASFAREARIAAAVRHANVAAVLDVEERGEGRDGEVTIILEYVEGASLAE